MLKLNAGCGNKHIEGYVNIDAQPMEEPDVVCNLATETWPFEDNSVDEIILSHVLEHIGPGPDPYFHFWKEMYRVCANGALIHIFVPHPHHDGFLNDPTHQRAVTPNGVLMFSKKHCEMLEEKGQHWTPFYKYLEIDFDLVGKVQLVFDEEIRPLVAAGDKSWEDRWQHENNIVAEYRMVMRAVKEEGE